jgi:alpha-ribazole phosphatase
MALILLRHTRPVGAEGLCYGRTDLDLAPEFDAEVARLATALPAVARILTSPLSRCLRLATALGSARGLTPVPDPRLIEMDFGDWENRPWAALPRDELDAWAADMTGARPHGGETVAELGARTRLALADALAGPRPTLVVTHSGVIKAALHPARGEAAWHAQVGFGQWIELDPDLCERVPT